jgi:N utilization substance protein A
VREVRLDDETGTATVVVSDYQLSLAIGKEGQNARLAARLTGWRIDIKSETQLAEEEAGYAGEEWAEGEWVENEAGEMGHGSAPARRGAWSGPSAIGPSTARCGRLSPPGPWPPSGAAWPGSPKRGSRRRRVEVRRRSG